MYELVPPKSKVIDYESPYLKNVVFKLKVFDFAEDEQYNQLIYTCSNIKKVKGKKEKIEVDDESYYFELFKLGVKNIKGIEGKFTPSWRVIKSVVNKIVSINSVIDLEK